LNRAASRCFCAGTRSRVTSRADGTRARTCMLTGPGRWGAHSPTRAQWARLSRTAFLALSTCATRARAGRADHVAARPFTSPPYSAASRRISVPIAWPCRRHGVREPPFIAPAYKMSRSSPAARIAPLPEPPPPRHGHPAPSYLASLVSQPLDHPHIFPRTTCSSPNHAWSKPGCQVAGAEAPTATHPWYRRAHSSEHLPPPLTPQNDPRWLRHHPRPLSRPIPALPWLDSGDLCCWPRPGTQLQKMIST
jgi:hypothetical protein